jgi:hypothetical protein
MSVDFDRTIWEKLGAAQGLLAAALLTINLVLMLGAAADPSASDAAFHDALQSEQMRWEWMLFLRVVAGITVVWWTGSLAGRLRLAEGTPGRLASISLGIGTAWGAVWLLSALFTSTTVLLANGYRNLGGSRVAGALAVETAFVLTPAIMVGLTFAVALVALRFGGFARWYAVGTLGLSGLLFVLAIVNWAGSSNLSLWIMAIALAWMALTSALLIPTYQVADLVAGAQGRVAS